MTSSPVTHTADQQKQRHLFHKQTRNLAQFMPKNLRMRTRDSNMCLDINFYVVDVAGNIIVDAATAVVVATVVLMLEFHITYKYKLS